MQTAPRPVPPGHRTPVEDDWQYNDLGQLSAAGGATGATYWPGSALKQLVLGSWTESRSYNVSGQLTQQQVPGVLNIEYGFSATQNDGRIEWRKDNGVQTSYGYDDLGRLTGATAPSWGMSFSYDGFGNRTAQSATAGSVPTWSQSIDPATNRILGGGYGYDTVGNMTAAPGVTMTYDMAGRMTASGTANYWYDAANRRVWKQTSTKTEFFFYGPGGMMLGVFEHKCPSAGCHFDGTTPKLNFYFGGRLVKSSGQMILTDRLGSVMRRGTDNFSYYPYGELQSGPTGNDQERFGTYWRDDANGLDYAMNRWYGGAFATFTSPDPYQASGGTAEPRSWNRYAYVGGDPVNNIDPSGLRWSASLEMHFLDGGGGWGCDNIFGWAPGTFCALQIDLSLVLLQPPALKKLRRAHHLRIETDCCDVFANGKVTRRVTYGLYDEDDKFISNAKIRERLSGPGPFPAGGALRDDGYRYYDYGRSGGYFYDELGTILAETMEINQEFLVSTNTAGVDDELETVVDKVLFVKDGYTDAHGNKDYSVGHIVITGSVVTINGNDGSKNGTLVRCRD